MNDRDGWLGRFDAMTISKVGCEVYNIDSALFNDYFLPFLKLPHQITKQQFQLDHVGLIGLFVQGHCAVA